MSESLSRPVIRADSEDALAALNDLLTTTVSLETGSIVAPPSVFVLGAPRSGTTILTQLLAYVLEIGVIDNLAACFWTAPEIGAVLSQKLVRDRVFQGQSTHGRTTHISEPHEYGAFWRHFLDYPGTAQLENHSIEWEPLLKCLDNVARIHGSSMLYKVFQLGWHAAEFHSLRPDTRWIWITRNEADNVRSLLRYRESIDTADEAWASVVPLASREFSNAPPVVKCASQVVLINEWIAGQLHQIPSSQWLHIELDTLISDPITTLQATASFLGLELCAEKSAEVQTQLVLPPPSRDLTIVEALAAVRRSRSGSSI